MKKKASEHEQRRRSEQSARDKLLYDRAETGHLLGGVSTSTLIRLEETGKLVPIKPSGRENGKTFYTSENVHRLAGCEQVTEVA